MPSTTTRHSAHNAGPAGQPGWHSFPITIFEGRETQKHSGAPYSTMPLIQLFTMEPGAAPKLDSLAFIPSTYCEHDARSHAAQRARGRYVALTADIDSGDHPRDAIEAIVRTFAGEAGWLIYSSASSRPGNRKWRAVVPLARSVGHRPWGAAQSLFHDTFAAAGIEPDRTLARAGQIVFAPNVPPIHEPSGAPLRRGGQLSGEPLYYDTAGSGLDAPGLDLETFDHAVDLMLRMLAEKEEEVQRQLAAEETARRRRDRASTGSTIIERFNAAHDIADLLIEYGYDDAPHSDIDWRSPYQRSGSYATRVVADADGNQSWISLSGSDAEAALGSGFSGGRYGDAFDLFAHFEHGGDAGAARAALRNSEGEADLTGVSLPPVELKAEVRMAAETQPASGAGMRWAQSGDAYDPDEDRWLISGMIPATGTGFLSGAWQSGKTFLLYHLAACLGGQTGFFGELPDGCFSTIILQAENFESGRKRLRALDVARGVPSSPLPIHVADAGGFGTEAERDAMLLAIEQRAGLIRDRKAPPLGLIGIDTLSASRLLAEENSNDSAAKAVEFMNLLSRRFGCFVLALHHPPKSSNGLRGGGALAGNVDTVIEIHREGSAAIRKAECIKQRDGEQKAWGCFTLLPIVIGTRGDGKEVTSCTVSTGVALPMGEKVTGAKSAALKVLDALAGPDGRAGLSEWRDKCSAADTVSSANRDKIRRDTVNRTLRELKALGLVEVGEDAGGWLTRKTRRLEGEPIPLPEL